MGAKERPEVTDPTALAMIAEMETSFHEILRRPIEDEHSEIELEEQVDWPDNEEDLEELEKLSLIEELFPISQIIYPKENTGIQVLDAFNEVRKARMEFVRSLDNKRARDVYDILEK